VWQKHRKASVVGTGEKGTGHDIEKGAGYIFPGIFIPSS
jgi:hypothetical protein